MGEVKSFSLSGLEFGQTEIPATSTDPDRVTLEGVKVGFNLIPLIFRRTLPVDISLVRPNIYLEQERDGEWVNLDFLANDNQDKDKEQKDPLVYLNIGVDIAEGNITAVPLAKPVIELQLDGSGRYNQAEEQLITYDLDAAIEQAKATVKGETTLETGQTNTKLLVKDLALSDVATLLPNSPVSLSSGKLNADLEVDLPSGEEITSANVKGMVSIQNVTGEATDLDSSLQARSQLDLNGREADISNTQVSLGNIVAQLDGKVNLDKGYDLDIKVLPFRLASLPKPIIQQLPVNVAGEVAVQLQVGGEITQPSLTGTIKNIRGITVDKTGFKTIKADFNADLAQVTLKNLEIVPLVGGEIRGQGTIETNIDKSIANKTAIDANKMPVAFNFKAKLPTQDIVTPYYPLPEVLTVGDLNAQGRVKGTIGNPEALVRWSIPEAATTELEDLAGEGEILLTNNNLRLQDTTITVGDKGKADINAEVNLDNKQWQAAIAANSFYLTPFLAQFENPNLNLDRPIALDNADIKLNGRLDDFDLNKIKAVAELNLEVDGANVVVDSQLDSGNVRANVTTNEINLNPLVPSLPVPATVRSLKVNASSKLEQLLALQENPNLNSLKADAKVQLGVDGETVAVNSQLDSGNVRANVTTNEINLNRILPNLPVPATVRSSRLNASSSLEQLLTFAENPNLSTVDANVNADLRVAEGTVEAIASLNNNQWQANLDATNVSSALLLEQFAPDNIKSLQLDNINAQAELAGEINPLINNEVNIPIAINWAAVQVGEQNLNAQGNLTLSNITTNLDIANTDLNVDAQLDLEGLPIEQIMAQSSDNNQLITDNVNFKGDAVFNGQFQGKNLISAPTESSNLSLTGDLQLLDFAFNEIDFDPVMTGSLNIRPDIAIALTLAGKQDLIAATAVPCTASNCRLPYLPNSLELRQGENTPQPIIAIGDRNQDLFSLDIQNFPLALLNLAPGKAAGIEGLLAGKTTGKVNANLYTLAVNGEIEVKQPAVGYIQADKFTADFNYDPEGNIAEVTTASLNLDKSQYNLNAALDLQTGAIDGKLAIPEAYIQDILTTLRWFTIEDITTLFNIPDYAVVSAVKPTSEAETVDESIAKKLNRLRNINHQIQLNAAAKETGNVPTSLNIQGKYSGEIALGGTITAPEASFNLEGNDWQWQPQLGYMSIVPPLGLIKEESQYLTIPQLSLKGDLKDTVVDLENASIQIEDALLSLTGKLSPKLEDAQFRVENLTVDTISNFVKIPVDIAGAIDATGTIQGSPSQPKIAGEVTFSQGSFNGDALPTTIAGNFDYNGKQLAFKTNAPDSIQVDATVPYPIIPGVSDRVKADVKLGTEAFSLLGALSQEYLNWIDGEGDAQLQAEARLDLNRAAPVYDLDATGVVNLNEAQIALKTPFFTESFQGTGKITIDNQIVNVETLEGTFADKDLSITGSLPLLKAVEIDNPLTVDLPEGKIKLDQLYKGGVEGKVKVTRTALEPIIGGKVSLKDGRVSIPKTETPSVEEGIQLAKDRTNNNNNAIATSSKSSTKTPSTSQNKPTTTKTNSTTFVTTLNNFQVELENFVLKQTVLYKFSLTGDLTLNGTVDQPDNIKPEGTLKLTQADVDLLSTSFNLARNRENTIVFTPDEGVFNPTLDIILRTEVSELNNVRLAESGENAINDPLSQAGNTGIITVDLTINGETEEILSNLGKQELYCNIRPNNSPLTENPPNYTQSELDRLTQCLNANDLERGGDRQILNSPAVKLTSIPHRSQGEIVSLFGQQFLAFAESIKNSSQEELFNWGVNQFIITPISRKVVYEIEDTVVGIGKKIGLDYLRFLPNLEGIYGISPKSSVRSTYNYVFNEVRLEYQLRF